MLEQREDEPVDFVSLDEAAKRVLGYYVYRRFHNYLMSVTAALQRQAQDGLHEGLTRPTARGRAAPVDVRALDYDAFVELVGVYMYVLSCHKSANWQLLHRSDAKQVLYLRGYDFEAAFRTGSELAAGLYTMDTERFTLNLPSLVRRQLFKVLSPLEVHFETVTAERYYENFDALIQWIRQRPAAVYLNALHWKEGVLALLPRMDYYVVYVSSLTESALWELDQLNTDGRRGRVTVVFDERAIARKESQLAVQAALVGRLGEAIWTKQGGPPSLTAAQVRDGLAEVFTVMTPDAFGAEVADLRHRIDGSHAELDPGERETWLDFAFYPAVPPGELEQLRAMSGRLGELVDAGQAGPIECIPLYIAQLQLRIYTTLILGEHAETGRALAAYAAVMQGASGHDATAGERATASSEDDRTRRLAVLGRHGEFAEYAGRRLLAYGRSHEFVGRSGEANASWDAVVAATRASVDESAAGRRTPP